MTVMDMFSLAGKVALVTGGAGLSVAAAVMLVLMLI